MLTVTTSRHDAQMAAPPAAGTSFANAWAAPATAAGFKPVGMNTAAAALLPATAASAAAAAKWYRHTAVHHVVALVAVFVATLVLLVLIQPPFVQSQPDDELRARQFSGGRAAVGAACATVIAAIAMVVAFVATRKAKRN